MSWIELLTYGLATFRMSLMLSKESGPAWVFERLRELLRREAKKNKAVRETAVHEGIQCILCVGVWIGAPVAAFAMFKFFLPDAIRIAGEWFVLWMALSAISVICNQCFTKGDM